MEPISVPAQNTSEDVELNISDLPKEISWRGSEYLYKYQGFWAYSNFLKGIILLQKNFIPQPNDILVCSTPKSGTTWLKSLAFSISTRSKYQGGGDLNASASPLLSKLSHDIVPVLEFLYYQGLNRDPENPLISTHVPFPSLPESILNSNNKILFMCRNPKDVFVSLWHFAADRKLHDKTMVTFEEAYEQFCNGVMAYGPYWDHVLGYWKASLEFPDRILFLKYEDVKNDTGFYVKRMADFMGCPISDDDEEKQGIVENIVQFCSFETLSNLEVNKNKKTSHLPFKIENNEFFRKGEIGDWKNHLTDEMAGKLDEITHQKFSGYGLYI